MSSPATRTRRARSSSSLFTQIHPASELTHPLTVLAESDSPSDELITRAADALVFRAINRTRSRPGYRSSPKKSVRALLRAHSGRRLSPEVEDRLIAHAYAALAVVSASDDGRQHESDSASQQAQWLTLEEAAEQLRTTARTLRDRLATRSGRRALGWPRPDGHRCWIPSCAVDPTRAAGFLATLPADEPWHSDDLCPWWVA